MINRDLQAQHNPLGGDLYYEPGPVWLLSVRYELRQDWFNSEPPVLFFFVLFPKISEISENQIRSGDRSEIRQIQ